MSERVTNSMSELDAVIGQTSAQMDKYRYDTTASPERLIVFAGDFAMGTGDEAVGVKSYIGRCPWHHDVQYLIATSRKLSGKTFPYDWVNVLDTATDVVTSYYDKGDRLLVGPEIVLRHEPIRQF